MELLVDQFTKNYKNNVVKLSVFICVIYVAVFGSVLSLHGLVITAPRNYINAKGDHFESDSSIKFSHKFSDIVNSERIGVAIQNLASNYKTMLLKEIDLIFSKYDIENIHDCFIKIWPELRESHVYKTISRYAESSKLTEIYTRVQRKMSDLNPLAE